MKIVLNEVTWYSKLAAILFFLLAVPVLCFYVGTQYQLEKTTLESGNAPQVTYIAAAKPAVPPAPDVQATKISTDGLSTVSFASVSLANMGPEPMQKLGDKKVTIALGEGDQQTSLQILEVCDVRFETDWYQQTKTAATTLDLSASDVTVQKIIKENPAYFTKDEANCVGASVWKENAAQLFYFNLAAGKTGPLSQKWFKSFDAELASISKAATPAEAATIIGTEK